MNNADYDTTENSEATVWYQPCCNEIYLYNPQLFNCSFLNYLYTRNLIVYFSGSPSNLKCTKHNVDLELVGDYSKKAKNDTT